MAIPLSIVERKLLKSAQGALPVMEDFWGGLATGLGEDVRPILASLQERGIVAGFCGEPNPAHPEVFESIAARERVAKGVVRWQGDAIASVLSAKDGAEGWRAVRWFKAGFGIDVREDGADSFAPERDRTMHVSPDEAAKCEPATPVQRRVLDAFGEPVPFVADRSPWEVIGERASASPAEARDAVVRLVLTRRWRRFALRVNAGALGRSGGGLACWRIGEQVERAAMAAAGISATGDVAVREPGEEWPFDLSALIPSPAEGDGGDIARAISGKWGVELGRWVPDRPS